MSSQITLSSSGMLPYYPEGTRGVFKTIYTPGFVKQYAFSSTTKSIVTILNFRFHTGEPTTLYIAFNKNPAFEKYLESHDVCLTDGDRKPLGYQTTRLDRIKKVFDLVVNNNDFPPEEIEAVKKILTQL